MRVLNFIQPQFKYTISVDNTDGYMVCASRRSIEDREEYFLTVFCSCLEELGRVKTDLLNVEEDIRTHKINLELGETRSVIWDPY